MCTRVCKVHRETARASGPRVSACWVEDWLSTPLGTEQFGQHLLNSVENWEVERAGRGADILHPGEASPPPRVTLCAVCVRVQVCDGTKEDRAHFLLCCPQAPWVRIMCAEGRGRLAGCSAGVGGPPDRSPHPG